MDQEYELDEEFSSIPNKTTDPKLKKDMAKIMNKISNIKTESDKKRLLDEMQYELQKIENEKKDPKQKMKEKLAAMKKNRGRK